MPLRQACRKIVNAALLSLQTVIVLSLTRKPFGRTLSLLKIEKMQTPAPGSSSSNTRRVLDDFVPLSIDDLDMQELT